MSIITEISVTSPSIYDIIIADELDKIQCDKTWRNIMEWKKVEYSKKQIDKAGKALTKNSITATEEKQALDVINNWRASHAFPLHIITCHLRRISPSNAVVVQRLKRLDSIIGKLKRFPSMNLYRMQDLGGCRVIVETMDDVDRILEKLKYSRMRHILKNEHDYIYSPKLSGYRCHHMIYQYQSDKVVDYNKNMLIEVQIRTHLQHLWATAIETMGIYTHSALKASVGDEDILRFFALVSSLFALEEGLPLVPDTPTKYSELIDELTEIDQRRKVVDTLKAIRVAIDHVKEHKGAGYYLLRLDFKVARLHVNMFRPSEIEAATNAYNKMEALKDANTDAVLVSASSFDSLRAAYPNYFADIGEFIKRTETYTHTIVIDTE